MQRGKFFQVGFEQGQRDHIFLMTVNNRGKQVQMSKPATEDLFSTNGRRNRKSFFLYHFLCLCGFAIIGFLGGITIALPPIMSGSTMSTADGPLIAFAVVMMLALLVYTVSSLFVGAQRCRDFGWTGWAILLTAIPYLGAIFWLALFFIPGTEGQNRYGEDPTQ